MDVSFTCIEEETFCQSLLRCEEEFFKVLTDAKLVPQSAGRTFIRINFK